MRLLVVLSLVVLSTLAEEKEKHKRHLFGEAHFGLQTSGNLFLGGPFGHKPFTPHNNIIFDTHGSYGAKSLSSHGGYLFGNGHGGIYGGRYGHPGLIDLGAYVHKHVTVTKKIGIPVPQPYPVHIEKKIPVPVPHPVPVPVDKPYPVHVPKPYPVPVEKPVPYTVIKPVPVPIKIPIRVPVAVPVPVSIPHPVPVTIHKPVPVPIPHPITFRQSFVPQSISEIPQFTQQLPQKPIALGSGSLGVVRLANGKFVLGSGSLGYSQGTETGRFTVATAVQNGATSYNQNLSTGDKLQQTSPQVFTPAPEQQVSIQTESAQSGGQTVVQNAGYSIGNEVLYNSAQNLGSNYDASLSYESTAVPFCGHENTVIH